VRLDRVFGKNLAATLTKLGPSFIKLGQVLATRPDLVGEPVSEELKVLFDRVPAVPFFEIKRILNAELGEDRVRDFLEIETKPLASASISQTHRATLKEGQAVILKVQKPGTADLVRLDLMLLEMFVRPLHLVYPALHLLQSFKDFKRATLREIDYREEARNIDRFRRNNRKIFKASDVLFPRYYKDLSTEKVLTLEPMRGRRVSDLVQGTTVARRAANAGLVAVLEQIFDHGFFHADPHGGNLFFLEDEGRLGFIDLGMVGQLEPEDKRKFLKVVLAILERDRRLLARHLFDLGTPGKRSDFSAFDQDIQKMLDDVKAKGVDKLRLDQMVTRLLGIARQHDIVIPNRYVMMIRSCLVIEGLAKSLDPNLSLVRVATPIVAKSLMKSYTPWRILGRMLK